MSDWWSKKLAGETPTPSRPNLPPVQAPIGFPQVYPSNQQTGAVVSNPNVMPEDATLSDYLRSNATQGGKAARTEKASCPECGSNYLFTRTGTSAMNPAPRCYECGWNGMYSQADQSSWS
jgi:predicted RNA-binding Zn-ribbon protein involved in translation (DUF1610 family)